MKLACIRLFNFQCYGPTPTEIYLDDLTVLIGPNGSGKTAALQALCRMFAFDPRLRKVVASDFHVQKPGDGNDEGKELWVEADFLLEELVAGQGEGAAVPTHFTHMRLDAPNGVPRVRYRLEADMDIFGEIDFSLYYVTNPKPDGTFEKTLVPKANRNHIQLHYLPARRDPATHITYGLNTLLGRLLQAAEWAKEKEEVDELTGKTTECLACNSALNSFNKILKGEWQNLHKGEFYSEPHINFGPGDIESLLRRLSLVFSPGHDEQFVDFSRLSDGQKSLLYLSLVLASQQIGRDVLSGKEKNFDPIKLRPAVYTMLAMEEPENSLAPHYLGRTITALSNASSHADAQALIATHAPSILKRIDPDQIRYLRLSPERQTVVSVIQMPGKETEEYKFVQQAVRAYPEIYFARLVVLGEGASEEMVLPRLFEAHDLSVDLSGITVAPLGGRHVNHFWRLLKALNIPHVTLLDLDLGRYHGGWGRLKYVVDQLKSFAPESTILKVDSINALPVWNDDTTRILAVEAGPKSISYLATAETDGVFFSSPLDLDFAMLEKFPTAFNTSADDQIMPDEPQVKAVLGKSYHGVDQYSDKQQKLFITYHKRFKVESKPAHHIQALSVLSDEDIRDNIPESLGRLIERVRQVLEGLPE